MTIRILLYYLFIQNFFFRRNPFIFVLLKNLCELTLKSLIKHTYKVERHFGNSPDRHIWQNKYFHVLRRTVGIFFLLFVLFFFSPQSCKQQFVCHVVRTWWVVKKNTNDKWIIKKGEFFCIVIQNDRIWFCVIFYY